jgi:hypothetical protein
LWFEERGRSTCGLGLIERKFESMIIEHVRDGRTEGYLLHAQSQADFVRERTRWTHISINVTPQPSSLSLLTVISKQYHWRMLVGWHVDVKIDDLFRDNLEIFVKVKGNVERNYNAKERRKCKFPQ